MASVSLKVNFAQISVDSSRKIIDISTKYTYGINSFKKIVGAVTIIFTDNESSFDTPGNESETQHLDKTTWKNIPASLSVLPTPAYTQTMDMSRGGVGLSSHNSLPHCHENIQCMEQTNADNMDDSSGDNTTAEKNQETSAISTHANITPVCSDGETIYIKKEPTSPFTEEFDERMEKSVDELASNVGRMSGRQLQHLNGKQSDVYFDKKPPHAGHNLQSTCSVCFREIQSKREFIFHARAHKNVLGGRESCPICLKSFTRNVGLMRHSSLHITSDLYKCPVCGINIVQLDGFKRHFHKRHPGSLFKLKCYLANFRHHTINRMASQDSSRNGHMVNSASDRRDSQAVQQMESEPHTAMTRNDSDFQDRQTSYHPLSLGKPSNQMMQIQVSAEGVQSVNLLTERSQCPDTFDDSSVTSSECHSSAVEFASHEDNQSNIHVHKNNTGPRSSSKSNGKKSAVCSFCWSEMTNMEDFLNHMEAHKSIMKVPHTCPVCLHEFSDKMRVKRHASKHVLTAMFACPFCPVQIARIDSLRRHVRKVHPAHADDFKVETNYATPPSGLATVTEDLSVSASSVDASASLYQSTEIEIKKECITSSSLSSVHQNAADSPYESDLPSEGAIEGQTYFNTPTGSTTAAHQDQQNDCSKNEPGLSWQQNSDQQHTQINPFISRNADKSSSPVSMSWGHSANVASSSGRLHPPKIFNSPKRGGSRPQTDMGNISMATKCDPAQFHSPNSAKKKGKNNKQLTSTCFFCSSTLTNTQEFLEHARLHAKDDKITCPVCVTDYARKLGLVRHSVNHVPSDAHVCSVCGTSFARRDVMLRHYRKVHKMCLTYFRHGARNPDSGATANSHDHDDLQILSFDAITAPSIPPLPGDGDMSPAVMGMADDDMMYSCGLCGAQYHDAASLQEHVQNHPHDI